MSKYKNFIYKKGRINLACHCSLFMIHYKLLKMPCSNSNTKMQHPEKCTFQNRKPGCDSFMLKKKKNGIITHRRVMVHEEHIVVKTIQEVKIKEEKKTVSCHEKVRGGFVGPTARERSYILAKKMKELEMLDAYNMDHVLDVHEVLHHYSHLTCPVYLDIVDKFFVNMYPDFFLPQPTVHVKKSMRKVHTVKL